MKKEGFSFTIALIALVIISLMAITTVKLAKPRELQNIVRLCGDGAKVECKDYTPVFKDGRYWVRVRPQETRSKYLRLSRGSITVPARFVDSNTIVLTSGLYTGYVQSSSTGMYGCIFSSTLTASRIKNVYKYSQKTYYALDIEAIYYQSNDDEISLLSTNNKHIKNNDNDECMNACDAAYEAKYANREYGDNDAYDEKNDDAYETCLNRCDDIEIYNKEIETDEDGNELFEECQFGKEVSKTEEINGEMVTTTECVLHKEKKAGGWTEQSCKAQPSCTEAKVDSPIYNMDAFNGDEDDIETGGEFDGDIDDADEDW